MAYKITWSDIALEDYQNIIEYLIKMWPSSVAVDFENTVNQKLDNLSKQPFTGIKSDKKPGIRSILFTKYNRLYYRIISNNIELLAIIDTRINPAKNPF